MLVQVPPEGGHPNRGDPATARWATARGERAGCDAFNVACTGLSGAGHWIADPTSVTLKAGATTTITMTFLENNPVTVTANFVPNIQSVSLGGSTFVVTDQGVLQSGLVSSSQTCEPIALSSNVAAGISHTCFLGGDGSVAWVGDNSSDQLGDGTTASRTTSATISGLTATQVVAGGSFTCALTTNGQPQCWGANSAGQGGVAPAFCDPHPRRSVAASTPSPLSLPATARSTASRLVSVCIAAATTAPDS